MPFPLCRHLSCLAAAAVHPSAFLAAEPAHSEDSRAAVACASTGNVWEPFPRTHSSHRLDKEGGGGGGCGCGDAGERLSFRH